MCRVNTQYNYRLESSEQDRTEMGRKKCNSRNHFKKIFGEGGVIVGWACLNFSHMEDQLKKVELFNGRAAMLGFVIGVITEGLTGQGILHQIGLGPLVDGYVTCSTQMLPFCF